MAKKQTNNPEQQTQPAAEPKPWEYPKDLLNADAKTIAELEAALKARRDLEKAKMAAAKAKADEWKAANDNFPGVKNAFNRMYCAGLAFKRFGLAAGVTEQMALWVGIAFGDDAEEGLSESRNCLIRAWHTLRGFTGDIPSPVEVFFPGYLAEENYADEEAWLAACDSEAKEALAKLTAEKAAADAAKAAEAPPPAETSEAK